jgi:NAD(P)-binding Rossmann-like domain
VERGPFIRFDLPPAFPSNSSPEKSAMESHMKLLCVLILAAFINVAVTVPQSDSDFDLSNFNPADIITRDVCIIGGGSSGTYAAIRLQDMGKSVVVVEKQDHLGGHVNTYTDSTTGEVINVGVQIFHNLDIVANYFQRLGVPLNDFVLGSSPTAYYDFDTGKTVPAFTPASPAAVGQAIQTYAGIIAANYSYLEAGYYLPDPVPEELLMPFGDFATKYGIGPIPQLINTFTQNNGEVWNQPTLYAIKAFGLALIQAFQTGFTTTHDVNDLYKSAANILGANVLYNSTITKTIRQVSSGYVSILVTTPSGVKLVRAKKLLMTGPPLLDNFDGWDLSSTEKDIFGKFLALGYYAGVVRNKGLPQNTSLQNIGANNPFFLNSLPGCFALPSTDLPGQHLFYYGTNSPSSIPDVQQGIVNQINRLTVSGASPAPNTDFLYFTDHSPYRLYASVSDIRNGFYKNLYALQGVSNTFWTGAAWLTHDSSLIWGFTEALLPSIVA